MNMRLKLLMSLALITVCSGLSYGQVTIGSGIPPEKGALLDLKEQQKDDGSDNASKGLILPRVNLSNLNKLYPMFNNPYDPAEDAKHIGLTVYNLTQCDDKFAQGPYIWSGTRWEQVINKPILSANPILTFPTDLVATNYFVEIPSGQDLRQAWTAAYKPIIAWASADSVTGVWTDVRPSATSGLVFNPPASTLFPSFPVKWTTSPISNISILPEPMTPNEVTTTPFLTRESKLTLTGFVMAVSPCPGGTNQSQTITLNQTNYAIIPSPLSTPSYTIRLTNTNLNNKAILSNVMWRATEENPQTGDAQLDDLLVSYTTVPTGSERHDGVNNNNNFSYKSTTNPVIIGKKYLHSNMRISDVAGRAKPISITVVQCQGTEDLSAVSKTATPTETTTGDPGWNQGATQAEKVVHHLAKPNPDYVDPIATPTEPEYVYDEFYSADFGSAGRWTVWNISAFKEDKAGGTVFNGPGSQGGNCSGGAIGQGTDLWNYPGGEQNWRNDKSQGLRYGTRIAQNNICPSGWHVASASDWDALQLEIYTHPELYSSINNGSNWDVLWSEKTTGLYVGINRRNGTTVRDALTDMCVEGGKSKKIVMGGFCMRNTDWRPLNHGNRSSIQFTQDAFFAMNTHPVDCWRQDPYRCVKNP